MLLDLRTLLASTFQVTNWELSLACDQWAFRMSKLSRPAKREEASQRAVWGVSEHV